MALKGAAARLLQEHSVPLHESCLPNAELLAAHRTDGPPQPYEGHGIWLSAIKCGDCEHLAVTPGGFKNYHYQAGLKNHRKRPEAYMAQMLSTGFHKTLIEVSICVRHLIAACLDLMATI
jgi:hypothetical protein